jgi:hypothetical protein
MKMLTKTATTAALYFVAASAAHATGYSVTGDFSTASNPNGVWSYGYITPSTGVFTAYTANGQPQFGTLPSWYSPSLGVDPVVAVNNTASTYTFDSFHLLSGWALFHPGPNDQQSDFRFTAPVSGSYTFNFSFQGADSVGPTTTDVIISSGNTTYYSQDINSFEILHTFNGTLALTGGQTIDIKVDDSGSPSDTNYFFDSTMLKGTITASSVATPEPATLGLLLTGLAGLGFRRRHRA